MSSGLSHTRQRLVRSLVAAGVLVLAEDPTEMSTWPRWRDWKTPVAYEGRYLGLAPGTLDMVAMALSAIARARFSDADLLIGTGAEGSTLAPLVGRCMGLPHLSATGNGDSHLRPMLEQSGCSNIVLIDGAVFSGRTIASVAGRIADIPGIRVVGAVTTIQAGQASQRDLQRTAGVLLGSCLQLSDLLDQASSSGVFSEALAEETASFYRDPSAFVWQDAR